MAQARRGARSEVTRLADLVRKAVDDGAGTAEEIHKSIADLPLDVLQRLDVLQETVKDVKRIQDNTIGAVYDAIRRINQEVNQLAHELLGRSARRKPAKKKKAKAQARRAAAA